MPTAASTSARPIPWRWWVGCDAQRAEHQDVDEASGCVDPAPRQAHVADHHLVELGDVGRRPRALRERGPQARDFGFVDEGALDHLEHRGFILEPRLADTGVALDVGEFPPVTGRAGHTDSPPTTIATTHSATKPLAATRPAYAARARIVRTPSIRAPSAARTTATSSSPRELSRPTVGLLLPDPSSPVLTTVAQRRQAGG